MSLLASLKDLQIVSGDLGLMLELLPSGRRFRELKSGAIRQKGNFDIRAKDLTWIKDKIPDLYILSLIVLLLIGFLLLCIFYGCVRSDSVMRIKYE